MNVIKHAFDESIEKCFVTSEAIALNSNFEIRLEYILASVNVTRSKVKAHN